MHQLKIDFSEFEFAFDSRRDLFSFYLDSETGEIISVSEEDQYYEAFITTVSNARIREQLNQAISGRGAFRSFKKCSSTAPRRAPALAPISTGSFTPIYAGVVGGTWD